MELRSEIVIVDFLDKLENGERACDLVTPPFEDEKDTQIRQLKEKLAKKERKIAELENGQDFRREIRQKDKIIDELKKVQKNHIFHLLIKKLGNFKSETRKQKLQK